MQRKNLRNKVIGGLAGLLLIGNISGCAWIDSMKESVHYRTITGKKCDIQLYSGGELVNKYENAKIVYSSTDSRTLLFESERKRFYWQGDALVEIK